MRVRIIDRTDDFIVLETSAPESPQLQPKITSVHIDAIIRGQTTLREQKDIARADGELRLSRLNAMNAAILADEE